MFIALDDINGLAGKTDFADWYKSFADEVATRYQKYPVFIMLVGLPEKRDLLSNIQPSLLRIFRPITIDKLSDEEVRQFLTKAFENVDIELKEDAADMIQMEKLI